jgi:hypothetical protein
MESMFEIMQSRRADPFETLSLSSTELSRCAPSDTRLQSSMLPIEFVMIHETHSLKERFSLSIEVKPSWSEWSDWGECSERCAGGERTRYRTCQNTKNQCQRKITCDGPDTQIEPCNTGSCRKSIDLHLEETVDLPIYSQVLVAWLHVLTAKCSAIVAMLVVTRAIR